MKTKTILCIALLSNLLFFSCKNTNSETTSSEAFKNQAALDELLSGKKDLGTKELNDAYIRQLQYQKKMKTGDNNGVVIPKIMLTEAINGFSALGINLPTDTSNFNKWDFLVVYSGLTINESKEEKMEPVVFFYKGAKDAAGNFIPFGKPLSTIKFSGGGGGDGVTVKPTPPPTNP